MKKMFLANNALQGSKQIDGIIVIGNNAEHAHALLHDELNILSKFADVNFDFELQEISIEDGVIFLGDMT